MRVYRNNKKDMRGLIVSGEVVLHHFNIPLLSHPESHSRVPPARARRSQSILGLLFPLPSLVFPSSPFPSLSSATFFTFGSPRRAKLDPFGYRLGIVFRLF